MSFLGALKTIHEGSPAFHDSTSLLLQSEKRLVRMTRKDLSHNVLEVEHTEGIDHWLVVKTMVHPKKVMHLHQHSFLSPLIHFQVQRSYLDFRGRS